MNRWLLVAIAVILCVHPCSAFAQETVLYYTTDAIGSVRMITDASGQVVERHDYLPFGEEYPLTQQEPSVEKRLFGGKEHDQETGFEYSGARYYAGLNGRFTTVDPGHAGGDPANPQSWNGYAYALNNPLRFVDPLGTCSQDAKGNYVDGDDAGTLVAPGPCPRGNDGALAVGVKEKVSVKSKPAMVALAEGIAPLAPVVNGIAIGTGVIVTGGTALGVAGGVTVGSGLGAEPITLGVARLAPLAPLAGQLNFSNTALQHMSNPGRMVPIQTLAEAIQSGARMPDPQRAAGAVKIVQQIFVNGTPRTLEIIYREADKTILHFLYK